MSQQRTIQVKNEIELKTTNTILKTKNYDLTVVVNNQQKEINKLKHDAKKYEYYNCLLWLSLFVFAIMLLFNGIVM